ncbi:MAG TPA: Nif11-like leader peptide family natural product precursor [Pirellulales bacterium]|nr:Nif11-like leader peptide family natural product precursor [Pirellulales bacterium]
MTTVTKMNPVEAFLKKVREDGQIRSQIEMLKNQDKKQALQEIVRIANKLNFKFNAKQYEEYATMVCSRKGNSQISDLELIQVACGSC